LKWREPVGRRENGRKTSVAGSPVFYVFQRVPPLCGPG
jgi:hypothetical protein